MIRITRPGNAIRGCLNLPFSKSIFNRVLMLEALSGKQIKVVGEPDSDDTRLMKLLLERSSDVSRDEPVILDAGNSGTVFRFLTAYLCLQQGNFVLTGSPRMKMRPVFPLVRALKDLGADITYLASEGYPPLMIRGNPGMNGNETRIDPSLSSQHVSALLLIAPFLQNGLNLNIAGKPVSGSYVELTLRILESLGMNPQESSYGIQIQRYIPSDQSVTVEKDWSSAAFWYEITALAGDASLDLRDLSLKSLQGDSLLPSLYDPFGVRTAQKKGFVTISREPGMLQKHIVQSFRNTPDLALPFAFTCAALGIDLTMLEISHLRIKESDRISSLTQELSKIGCEFHEDKDRLEIISSHIELKPGMIFHSHDDHRVAMSVAPLALKAGEIFLQQPEVVSKSYPGFWRELTRAGFLVEAV